MRFVGYRVGVCVCACVFDGYTLAISSSMIFFSPAGVLLTTAAACLFSSIFLASLLFRPSPCLNSCFTWFATGARSEAKIEKNGRRHQQRHTWTQPGPLSGDKEVLRVELIAYDRSSGRIFEAPCATQQGGGVALGGPELLFFFAGVCGWKTGTPLPGRSAQPAGMCYAHVCSPMIRRASLTIWTYGFVALCLSTALQTESPRAQVARCSAELYLPLSIPAVHGSQAGCEPPPRKHGYPQTLGCR